MNDEELKRLENPDEWDLEHAERRPGVKNTRAVVSVAFARPDFDRVSECAERFNKRTSEFIREAALEKVTQHQKPAAIVAYSGSPGAFLYTRRPLPSTQLSGKAQHLRGVEAAQQF